MVNKPLIILIRPLFRGGGGYVRGGWLTSHKITAEIGDIGDTPKIRGGKKNGFFTTNSDFLPPVVYG